MIRLALVGASGRTGRLVVDCLPEFPSVSLVAALVSPGSRVIGQLAPNTNLQYSCDVRAGIALADVVIDFSRADVSAVVAETCADLGKPALIATTGHTDEQLNAIKHSSRRTALLLVSNTSLGLMVAARMVNLGSQMLGGAAEVEIVELHHRNKRDAPSGTAKTLAAAAAADGTVTYGREGLRQSGQIGIASLRGGDVVGEHTVYFFLNGERIEVTHRATDRRVFARGALRLAQKLLNRKPGLLQTEDLDG